MLAEACYLIDRELGPETEAAFIDDVGTTPDHPYQLVDLYVRGALAEGGSHQTFPDSRTGPSRHQPLWSSA